MAIGIRYTEDVINLGPLKIIHASVGETGPLDAEFDRSLHHSLYMKLDIAGHVAIKGFGVMPISLESPGLIEQHIARQTSGGAE